MICIVEEVRENYETVDALISNVKKVFLQSPTRIKTFKSIAPDLKLPPQPVLTRWGTWIEIAMYYSENLKLIRFVLNEIPSNVAESVKK